MLFNSHEFLFVFLPVVLAGGFLVSHRWGGRGAALWLLLASLYFYGHWSPRFLALLLGSIAFNYALGWVLCEGDAVPPAKRRALLCLGVAANLLVLAQCKYLRFFTEIANQLTGAELGLPSVLLPLAISFYTFQQIGYLVDTYRGGVRVPRLLDYALFVGFFPQLIAGPIVLHRELLPQLASRDLGRFCVRRLAIGLSVLVIGLAKKVLLADRLADWADPVFDAAATGAALATAEAWAGALAYTLQLYFDFSGYTDMALGLGLLFGVRLPVNFDSPYKACSIIDFWRRWHITLSRFLRDHLYIPLGGSRRGRPRRYLNLAITMLLGGLWHGAGWTFVIWGGLHGAYLIVNHGWRHLVRSVGWRAGPLAPAAVGASRLLTFGAVVVAWVFFRAESLPAAWIVLGAMAGKAAVSTSWVLVLGAVEWGVLAALVAGVWWLPNTQELVGEIRRDAARDETPSPAPPRLAWTPSPGWALALGGLAFLAATAMVERSEFIYFHF